MVFGTNESAMFTEVSLIQDHPDIDRVVVTMQTICTCNEYTYSVPVSSTVIPGRNLRQLGFGVSCV